MKKLLGKISVVVLFILSICFIFVVMPLAPNDPMQLFKQKHNLLETLHGKRIICVGGSGTFYSISASLLQSRFKEYRAVNMGLNAGLGLRFNLNEIKPCIKAGDIIILVPEYSNYGDGLEGSVITLLAINSCPKVLKSIPFSHLSYLIYSHGLQFIPLKCLNYLNSIGSYISHSSYYSMNQNGDIILNDAPKDVSKIQFSTNLEGASYRTCVKLLNDFYSFCTERKAVVVLLFPALPKQYFEKENKHITSLYDNLSRDIRMPVLCSPEQAAYPLNLFHDTEYHMTPEGRKIHTLFIISCLKKFYPALFKSVK
jgi:hypothetical protein